MPLTSPVLQLELPWPPSVNNYWRHTTKGHYISKKGKEFREFVFYRCLPYKNIFKKEDRLLMQIEAYPPDKRKRDLDNIFKSLLDSLQYAGIYFDDSQIDKLSINRHSSLENKIIVLFDCI